MNFKSPVETTDVLIVGAGPAGLMASLCLHTFGLSVLHIDNRPEPTSAGRADGIQPRTLEVHPSLLFIFLFTSSLDPTPDKQLARTSRARSCPDFIDVRDRYTLLLHQGIIEREFLAEISARAPNSQVLRPFEFVNCRYHASGKEPTDYPIEVTVRSADGTEKLVRTKYYWVVMAPRVTSESLWEGLSDWKVKKLTSFGALWIVGSSLISVTDLKLKCLIHSRNDGSIMVIPRENNLVRFYVQLVNGDSECDKDTATLENCQEQARKIFHPYTLKFGDTDWFSIYKIGQQIANAYTLDGRIILGGDAVHTHSPKAGQGMNISMLDMYSLAWKINLVEKGIGQREKIMETYEQERRGVAQELMAFDSEYSKLFSGRGSKIGSSKDKTRATNNLEVDPQRFIELFKQNAYFTSGCGAVYPSNVFNARADSHIFKSHIDCRIDGPLRAGERLLPGDAIRVIDGNPVRIEQEVRMDGAFRIYIFLGASPVGSRLDYLNESCCFLKRFRATTGQRCSVFDPQRAGPNPFFTFLLVTSRSRDEWDIADLPPLFSGPYASQVYVDLIENTVAGLGSTKTCSLHSKYGESICVLCFDEGEGGGGIIIVRPDGYVGSVVSFCETGWKAVERYFEGFLVESGV
ncbi:hypothetical protein PSHT_06120 [Puccinia striiformis]|uniref:FAD-binding domain-containing protein n=1 Tax=Puccinia striiformis TaxID=27350 RepID=A0A2S4W8U8_9BASI|nr:hypothetical protein PSHT_06120 [Puccinia striiformis]